MGDMNVMIQTDGSSSEEETVGRSTFYSRRRRRTVELSYNDTEKLLKSLEATVDILSQRLTDIQIQESQEQCIKRPRRCPRLRVCVRRTVYFFTGAKGITFTLLLQLITLVILTIVDTLPRTKDVKQFALHMGSILMIFLQSVNLIIVIIVSLQLGKQLRKSRVRGILLIQSYIATILLFSGLYTATYRLNPKSWKFIAGEQTASPVLILLIYCRLLFFSVSTGTLCGSADAMPKEWYNCLFASIQMLLSFLYFTSVLGLVLQPLVESITASHKKFRIKPSAQELGKLPHRTSRSRVVTQTGNIQ